MKILVVRFAAIGDCVMTSWAVTAIRNAAPDSKIYWAVQERCAPVIETDRLVDHIQIFPRERWKSKRWSSKVWREQLLTYTALRNEGIDVGFDLQGHSKTALCLKLSGCKERYASRATDALAAKLNPPADLHPEGPHEVQRAISLVRLKFDAHLPALPAMPHYAVPTAMAGQPRLVTIQTGAGETDKMYPTSSWDKVAETLNEAGHHVVAIGGPKDPQLSTIAAQSYVGKLSLQESLSVVEHSDLHLSGDTGTAHAASAYGVNTVTVFGRTDPTRFRPWGEKAVALREGTETNHVHPDQVVNAALTALAGKMYASPY